MKYKKGDKVKLVSKSRGRSFDEVKNANNTHLKAEWDRTGQIERIERGYYVIRYHNIPSVAGDYYEEQDILSCDEIESELFEI